MSTDNEMDELLRDAGHRWRAANPGSPTTVDFAAVTPPNQPRRNRWLVAAAAAVVVVGVAVGGTWLGTHRTHDNAQGSGKGIPERTTWSGLTGTEWKIFEVTKETSNSSDTTGVEGSAASLHIHSDGSFTGSDGCNSLSGTVRIAEGTMTFEKVETSEMACTDSSVTKNASMMDAILQGTVTWSIGDAGGANDLSIEHAGVGSLIYFGAKPPSPPVTDPSAVAGTWELTEYDHSDSSSADSSGSATGAGSPSGFGDLLVIDPDGTFKVQHRCYANAGTVLFGDGKATWSDVHLAGAIPCPTMTSDQKDEQTRNALVDGVLKGDTTWKIDNGQLRITKGLNTIVYSPYASDTTPTGSPTK